LPHSAKLCVIEGLLPSLFGLLFTNLFNLFIRISDGNSLFALFAWLLSSLCLSRLFSSCCFVRHKAGIEVSFFVILAAVFIIAVLIFTSHSYFYKLIIKYC